MAKAKRTVSVEDFERVTPLPQPLARRLFAVLDRNGDGVVDRDEYRIGLRLLLRGSDRVKLELLFELFDNDRDGQITRDELYALLSSVARASHRLVSQLGPATHHHLHEHGHGHHHAIGGDGGAPHHKPEAHDTATTADVPFSPFHDDPAAPRSAEPTPAAATAPAPTRATLLGGHSGYASLERPAHHATATRRGHEALSDPDEDGDDRSGGAGDPSHVMAGATGAGAAHAVVAAASDGSSAPPPPPRASKVIAEALHSRGEEELEAITAAMTDDAFAFASAAPGGGTASALSRDDFANWIDRNPWVFHILDTAIIAAAGPAHLGVLKPAYVSRWGPLLDT